MNRIEEIRAEYPIGTTIKLEKMAGEKQMPEGLIGVVSSVDDMGQIHVNWESGSSLALNSNEDKFSKIDSKNTIKVLLVEPMKVPKIVEIGADLESMQKEVGGYIEEIMPFDDEVAIVCNEEGKISGLELNRAIFDDDGKMIDIIAGTFFVCSAPFESEKFESLSTQQQKKYGDKFKYPERFFRTHDGIKAIPLVQNKKDFER